MYLLSIYNIPYLWCITNVSSMFTEITFDEAGLYDCMAIRIRANIRRNFRKHIYKL
jgi:hypothetical protein